MSYYKLITIMQLSILHFLELIDFNFGASELLFLIEVHRINQS